MGMGCCLAIVSRAGGIWRALADSFFFVWLDAAEKAAWLATPAFLICVGGRD